MSRAYLTRESLAGIGGPARTRVCDAGLADRACVACRTEIKGLAHAPDTADVSCVEVAGQARRRVVRDRERLFFALELEYRRQRAEGLLLGSSI